MVSLVRNILNLHKSNGRMDKTEDTKTKTKKKKNILTRCVLYLCMIHVKIYARPIKFSIYYVTSVSLLSYSRIVRSHYKSMHYTDRSGGTLFNM